MDELLLEPGPAAARDLSDRPGFDAAFLGVPVPVPTLPGVETVLLPYTHFSVLMRPDKRVAAVTALGHVFCLLAEHRVAVPDGAGATRRASSGWVAGGNKRSAEHRRSAALPCAGRLSRWSGHV